jgi:thiamine-monophosphate kinase
VWVSGELGDAALAVAHRLGVVQLTDADARTCRQRLDWPQPRVALGLALRGLVSAAVDVSDGLLADLGHVLQRSGVGASVRARDVPRSELMLRVESELQRRCVLAGGDDYELLFTASHDAREAIERAARDCCVAVTRIGSTTVETGLRLVGERGIDATLRGYDHFAGAPAAH